MRGVLDFIARLVQQLFGGQTEEQRVNDLRDKWQRARFATFVDFVNASKAAGLSGDDFDDYFEAATEAEWEVIRKRFEAALDAPEPQPGPEPHPDP